MLCQGHQGENIDNQQNKSAVDGICIPIHRYFKSVQTFRQVNISDSVEQHSLCNVDYYKKMSFINVFSFLFFKEAKIKVIVRHE